MSAARFIAGMGGLRAAQFIAESHSAVSAGTATVSYAGAQAGNLAVLIRNPDISSPPSGWTAAGANVAWPTGNTLNVCYKVLSSGDIAAGSLTVSGTNGGVVLLSIYAGPTVATIVSTAQTASATSLTVTGFTKSPFSAGVIALVIVNGNLAGTITPPSGTTTRFSSLLGSYAPVEATILPGAFYSSGSNLAWSWVSATSAIAQAIELT